MMSNQYIKNWLLIPQGICSGVSLPEELKFLEEWDGLPNIGTPAKQIFNFGNVNYLNNGAFGVVPEPIIQKMQQLERLRNANPFKFQNSYLPQLLSHATARLSSFVKSEPAQTFFSESVCAGIYSCLVSIKQQKPTPKVAYIKGSYVGLVSTLDSLAAKKVLELMPFEGSTPIESSQLASFLQNNKIDVFIFEHITNGTGFINNVKELAQLCKNLGIISIIDGAHAPGNIDLEITAIESDFYVGSCYKWLFSQQGCAFICCSKEWQGKFSPPYETFMKLNPLIPFYWRGGINYTPFISCICGISFYQQYGLTKVREHIQELKNSIEFSLSKHWNAEIISSKELCFSVFKLKTNLKKNLNLGICALDITSLVAEHHSTQISVVIPSNSEVLVRLSYGLYTCVEDVKEIQTSLVSIIQQFEEL